jgi:hypothetical protein
LGFSIPAGVYIHAQRYTLVVSPGIRDVLSAVILKTNVGFVKIGPAKDTELRQNSVNIGNMARRKLDLLFTIIFLHPTKTNISCPLSRAFITQGLIHGLPIKKELVHYAIVTQIA